MPFQRFPEPRAVVITICSRMKVEKNLRARSILRSGGEFHEKGEPVGSETLPRRRLPLPYTFLPRSQRTSMSTTTTTRQPRATLCELAHSRIRNE